MLYFGDGTIGNLIKDYGTYMNAEGKDVYRMIILLSPEAQNRYGLDINSSGVNDKGLLGGPYFEMDYPELHVHELQMMEDNLWVREIDVNPIGGETKKSQRHQLLKDTITIQKNEMRRYRTSMKVQLNKLRKQKLICIHI